MQNQSLDSSWFSSAYDPGAELAKLKRARAESAGGVVYRIRDQTIEVVLVGRIEPETWALPKGTPNRGETRQETALRETREETGLQTRIVEPIDQITYWFVIRNTRVCKTVYYYLMVAIGGSTSEHDPEYDRVAWFPVEKALEIMSYTNEAEVVRAAMHLILRREATIEPASSDDVPANAASMNGSSPSSPQSSNVSDRP